jgi:Peptidase family M23
MIVRTLAAAIAIAATTQASAAEVRTCGELRSTPLSDERNVQSGLLQAFAVVNTDSTPVTLTGVHFELKESGNTTDTRWLLEDDIARAVRQGPMVAAVAKMVPSQFCNGAMLAGTIPAKSATLAPGEALVFLHQPFAWQGSRDTLNIAAVAVKDGVSRESLTAVRISAATARTQALFPVAGRSYVAVAASFHTPHRWLRIEEFALDIVMMGKGGSTHRGDGTRMTDYVAFGQPIRAVADGKVVRVASATPDNVAMLIRPGESSEAYLARLVEAQNVLIAKGIEAVLGNHVVIDHGNGEYSVYAHLKQGSPHVVLGQQVKAGETIGALGSSGNSTEPHLHFQMCDNADMSQCHALQPVFHGFRLPLELSPRTIQSGDIVETTDDAG